MPSINDAKLILSSGNIEKKKDEEQPGPSGSSSSFCDDIVLKKLAVDFETFCLQNQRKQNMLTRILRDLLSEVKSLKNIITEIDVLRISDTSNMRTESIFEKLKLPSSTLEEFKEIENYLQPQENFTNVVR
ncbi:hypothetical protein JTB14_024986 [Gonioctena quinquepunctata]|nr:hypothetical protein JTB14_024986 [Gonioctena quinquepunctata]